MYSMLRSVYSSPTMMDVNWKRLFGTGDRGEPDIARWLTVYSRKFFSIWNMRTNLVGCIPRGGAHAIYDFVPLRSVSRCWSANDAIWSICIGSGRRCSIMFVCSIELQRNTVVSFGSERFFKNTVVLLGARLTL
jgi:hypothetical protein